MGNNNLSGVCFWDAMQRGSTKGKLTFVGLGLHDDSGVSLKGLQEMIDSDVIFAEDYTSRLETGAYERLQRRVGKTIQTLDRKAVEDGSVVLEACKGKRVSFLVVGDPMGATTHIDLRLRAAKAGFETAVIHGASIMTAVPGILGLQNYKFGRTTTVPFPQEGYAPTSPYEVIAENLSRGLHTLVLLDIDAEGSRYMTANEGLHILMDMERRLSNGVLTSGTLVCVVARAGAPDCLAMAGPVSVMLSQSFGPPLHTIVVPGKLHFMEEEALDTLVGKPE
jgi:diphthine synthase